MNDLKELDIAKVALAIEADAGQALPSLRQALAEAKAGRFAVVHRPEQIMARKRGRPAGSQKADAKVRTTLRLDPDILQAFKAQGPGWQTRINETLRSYLAAGRL